MLTIQAKENDDQILLRSMGPQRMKYVEDENQNYTNIDSQFCSQTDLKAVPMYYFPVPKGDWSVDISCEGYQPTVSKTDPNKGKSDGLIAYAQNSSDYWNVGESDGVKITRITNDNTFRAGHPNLEINSCHFNDGQLIERDATISFHVSALQDGRFFLVGPPIQKTGKYNYTISYGEWTDRDMELGLLTVILDEHLEGNGSALGSKYKRQRRVGHSPLIVPQIPENRKQPPPPVEMIKVAEPPEEEIRGLILHTPPPSPPRQEPPGFWTDNPDLIGQDDGNGGVYWNEDPENLAKIPPPSQNEDWDFLRRQPLRELDVDARSTLSSRSKLKGVLNRKAPTGNYAEDYANKENIHPDTLTQDPVMVARAAKLTDPRDIRELKEQAEYKRDNYFMLPPKTPKSRWGFGGSSTPTLRGKLKTKMPSRGEVSMINLTTQQVVEYETTRRSHGETVARALLDRWRAEGKLLESLDPQPTIPLEKENS